MAFLRSYLLIPTHRKHRAKNPTEGVGFEAVEFATRRVIELLGVVPV